MVFLTETGDGKPVSLVVHSPSAGTMPEAAGFQPAVPHTASYKLPE